MVVLGLVLAALAGCSQESTGVDLQAHVVGAGYDELRFGVFLSPPENWLEPEPTIVDPDTQGRIQGPFVSEKPEQLFYLKDDLAARTVRCDVVALANGVVTARGGRLAMVNANTITMVSIFLSPNVTNNGSTDQPPQAPPIDPGQVINAETSSRTPSPLAPSPSVDQR